MKLGQAIFLAGILAVALPCLAESLNCDQPFDAIRADASPNIAYFNELLHRGIAAPLSDFMRLWYPKREGSAERDPTIELCISSRASCELKMEVGKSYSADDFLRLPQVHLDTVYSWGPAVKLTNIQKALPDNGVWSGPVNPGHTLDTLFSAIGSYGYGLIPVRIRLSPKPGQMSVSVRSDYEIEDGNEIESWSYGTPEHYDEIVRDYLRFKSGAPWVGYSASADDDEGNHMQLFFAGLDGHDFSEKALKSSLLEMIRMILNGEGRIHYAHGTCRNRRLAFETRYPTYINPFVLEKAN